MGLREAMSALTGSSNDQEAAEAFTQLREELRAEQANNGMIQESLQMLELAMEDEGWRRFGMNHKFEFTRGGLTNLIDISRMMYMANPLIQRAVNVKSYYTWGQGVSVRAADSKIHDLIIEPMMADEGNKAELYSHQARLLTDIDQQVEGNLFFRLPTEYNGDVSVRSVPVDEIVDIHTKPGDPQQIWFYRRVWSEDVFNMLDGSVAQESYEALYPDYRYHPRHKPDQIGDYEVKWSEPIIHQRTGGMKKMQFGVPETYSVLDWARAYKKFLENWHSIVSSLAKFAWRRTTTPDKIEAERAKLQATASRGNSEEGNPPPAAGSVFLDMDGQGMEPIKTAGTTTRADDARASRLMVAAGTGLPDTILSGDVDIGNFATSKTLDRPTELQMRNRQLLFQSLDKAIFGYAIEAKVRRRQLPGRVEYKSDGTQSKVIMPDSTDSTVKVSFPPVLEHDAKEVVTAIVSAATLDGKVEAGTIERPQLVKMLLEALNVEDVDGVLAEMDPETQQSAIAAAASLAEALKQEMKDDDKTTGA